MKLKELQRQAWAHNEYHTVPPLQIASMVQELEEYRHAKSANPSCGGTAKCRTYTTHAALLT